MSQKTAAEHKKPFSVAMKAMRRLFRLDTEKTKKSLISLDAFAQERIIKQFFDMVAHGNKEGLVCQISRLEMANVDTKPVINAINKESGTGATLLISASKQGFTDICGLLAAKGADVNARDDSEDTALMYAAANGHTETCGLLVGRGADVNAKDSYNRTALHWAASRGCTKLCELLIEKGAKVKARDRDGLTPLQYAVKEGHGETEVFFKSMEKPVGPEESI